ncbi:phosphoadenosine phosphosulfate reductase family protein [Dyadobacter luticola]|uniref:Phosphoadenosine phosphosulfate reductase family protein n=1 Tax=Dyadobacter luticola TaxID=1979387 RepID=A0A5R9KW08_9BACT|nr:phosphoadenosine phosphosulfate reductase family protein [Dyadobacter luticola]TLV00345.1 phosphoadenosine phosphosulfate reductase family protein [Dyadobacter luticola]
MTKVRHLLGISGGKDSAALAIYMRNLYPELDIEYYTCDTGKELEETYQLIKNLEVYLGKTIELLQAANQSTQDPFDHYLDLYGGFLPSANSRWCTKKLKLEPFEKFVGNDPVISYVGIRGDEDREGYISKKPNIQSIFPFRKNIWSEDVIGKALTNNNLVKLIEQFDGLSYTPSKVRFRELLLKPISFNFTQTQKTNILLDVDVRLFNELIFSFLKQTSYPLSEENTFPLVDNEDVLIREDIFKLLEESGVGVPAYYNKLDFDLNGKVGQYSRSRSGCYFCFYQQKIEWIWLYEQHPDRFLKAVAYEKDGYTWNDNERLEDLIKPARMQAIKEEYLKRTARIAHKSKSPYLLDILNEAEGEGCASCFI